jgi:hypothetical protein
MSDSDPASVDASIALHDINQQMELLMPKLGDANKACVDAARPLQMLAEMNSAQREAVAAQIRAAQRQWEEITQQVAQLLTRASALRGSSTSSGGNGSP